MSDDERNTTPTHYPEHAKLEAGGELRVRLAEFIAWLSELGVTLVRHDASGRSCAMRTDTLIGRFLGIDETALEAERRAMLLMLRRNHSVAVTEP